MRLQKSELYNAIDEIVYGIIQNKQSQDKPIKAPPVQSGTFLLKVVSAELDRDTELIGAMDPYCIVHAN